MEKGLLDCWWEIYSDYQLLLSRHFNLSRHSNMSSHSDLSRHTDLSRHSNLSRYSIHFGMSNYKLSFFLLPSANNQLFIANCILPITNCRLPMTKWPNNISISSQFSYELDSIELHSCWSKLFNYIRTQNVMVKLDGKVFHVENYTS